MNNIVIKLASQRTYILRLNPTLRTVEYTGDVRIAKKFKSIAAAEAWHKTYSKAGYHLPPKSSCVFGVANTI